VVCVVVYYVVNLKIDVSTEGAAHLYLIAMIVVVVEWENFAEMENAAQLELALPVTHVVMDPVSMDNAVHLIQQLVQNNAVVTRMISCLGGVVQLSVTAVLIQCFLLVAAHVVILATVSTVNAVSHMNNHA